MRVKPRHILLFLLSTPLFMQCVPTGQDITNLDLRIRNLDNQMLKMEKKTATLTANNPIELLQQKQAEMGDTLDRLNIEFLQIKGQLEESSHFYRNNKEENQKFQEGLNARFDDLSEQIMLLADQMNQTSANLSTVQKNSQTALAQAKMAEEKTKEIEKAAADSIAEANQRALAAEAAAAEAARKAYSKPEITPEQTKVKYKDGKKLEAKVEPQEEQSELGPGKEIYDRALTLFRNSQFNEAYRAFTEYIEQYPNGKMAPNARFWLGDCYYSQQEYELAILEYQKVLADYSKDVKAPAALLKQGLAFEKLKDNDTAKIVYNKLLAEYPNSEQVESAKNRIGALR
jgi:tol-pal system protein YbgF